jgi:hypothetical protein
VGAEPELDRLAEIDAALAAWRQGDCVLGEHGFVHRFDASTPLTDDAREAAAADPHADLAESPVVGLVLVTQTCDIVRACGAHPFIEVCPLVEVDEERLEEVRRMRRPSLALVPGLAAQRFVADLARTMTVEKAVVARWHRVSGCTTDRDVASFAEALARKRQRFAFPDDFNHLVRPLQERLLKKHDKKNDEGKALRSLREIRVYAAPSWDAPEVELMFWFVREEDSGETTEVELESAMASGMGLISPSGRFARIDHQLTTLDDMTAADYVGSRRLDLDHLSSRSRG